MAEADTELVLQVGLETTVSDPVIVRRGARAGALLRPDPWWGVGAWVSGYPSLGRADWTVTTRELADNEVAPYLSRVMARGDLGAELTPLRAVHEGVGTALHLQVALGASYTVDDLTLVPATEEPERVSEWSPTMSWGASVDTWRGPVGMQIRCTQTLHRELAWDGQTRWKRPLWVGLDVSLRWPRDRE